MNSALLGAHVMSSRPHGCVRSKQRQVSRCARLQGPHTGAELSSGCPRIRYTEHVRKLYEFGREIRPRDGLHDRRVCLATRLCDGLEVVVKICLKPSWCNDKPLNDDRAWRRGFELLLELPEHEGLCRTYEVIEDETAFYVVMERVTGVDLGEFLLQRCAGVLDPALCREVLWRLLSAMAFLHARNVIHKDLKLENVVVNLPDAVATSATENCNVSAVDGGELSFDLMPMAPSALCVKIVDFDTLQVWSHGRPPEAQIVGTDGYASQEALAGRCSPLSDVFSLGVLAFRLLVGSFPFPSTGFFHAKSSSEKRQMRQQLRASSVSYKHPTFQDEPEAADLLSRMLEHNELHRPTSAQVLEHPWFERSASPRDSSTALDQKLERRIPSERRLLEPRFNLHDRVFPPARRPQPPRSYSTPALVDKPLPEVGCGSVEGSSVRRCHTSPPQKKSAGQTEHLPAFAVSRGTVLSGPGGVLRRVPPEIVRLPKEISSNGSLSPPSLGLPSPSASSVMARQAAGEISGRGPLRPATPTSLDGSPTGRRHRRLKLGHDMFELSLG